MMRRPFRLATVLPLSLVLPVVALGQATTTPPAPEGAPAAQPAADPMAGWSPRKVTPAQEKKGSGEIHQLFKKMEQAMMKGDLDAAVALVDFPVLMLTDTKAGEAVGEPYTEERWSQEMGPFYQNPPKDMRMTHSPKIFFISEALASVDDSWTMTLGKKKTTGRSSMLVIRKGGEWKVKAMVEGGWGDMGAPAGTEGAPGGAK